MKFIPVFLFLALSLLFCTGNQAMGAQPTASPSFSLLHSPVHHKIKPQEEDIRDIKGPVALPDNSRYLLAAAAMLAAIIVACLIFWYLKKRSRPQAPPLPPDAVALAELERAKKLMTPEQCLAYADRISAILRQYIEARFQIHTTRQTTREFFDRLKDGTSIAEVDIKNHAGDIEKCLEQCDIAKFAHGTPNSNDMMQMDGAARTFIETTRQKQESDVEADHNPSRKGKP
jgi:hypothetical protein